MRPVPLRSPVAAAGTSDPFMSKGPLARERRRISDTRVLCVAMVRTLGTLLSVELDTTARPVHDRARVPSPCDGARRLSRSELEESAMVVMIARKGEAEKKKSRQRCRDETNGLGMAPR